MTGPLRLRVVLRLVLSIAIVALCVRIAGYLVDDRLELSRIKLSQIEPATRALLDELEGEVLATYYVSGKENMPSHLQHVEEGVLEVLDAFQRAAPEHFRYQVVDPEAQPDLLRYVANQKVAPFRVRSVQRDSYSEATIWSTLTLRYGAHPTAALHGLLPDHLPRLQTLLREELSQMEHPVAPKVALCADDPAQYADLALDLGDRCELTTIGADEAFPDVDLLLWMEPANVTPERARDLVRFLDAGGSAVVAGSETKPRLEGVWPGLELSVEATNYDAATLLAAFGLRPVRALVLDRRCATLDAGDRSIPLPYEVNCIAPNQDFHTMVGQPNGHLLFSTPTPIEMEGDLAAELGWNVETLATGSRFNWVQEQPYDAPLPLEEMSEVEGFTVAKQPLVTLLRPVDPWKGSIAFCAAASPFKDGTYRREGYAHRAFSEILLETLASDERLVLRRADVLRKEPLPALAPAERVLWRALVIGALPLILGLLFLRHVRGNDGGGAHRRRFEGAGLAGRVAAVLALALAVALFAPKSRADLTRDRLNRLAPLTERLASEANGARAIEAELFVSPRDQLPPAMRTPLRGLRGLLGELDRAGADIDVRSIDPGELDEAERAALADAGIASTRVKSHDEDVTTVRTIWCSLRLTSGERSEVLTFASAGAFENLELAVAFALMKLETGRTPHVALVSDLPRLSPAEAHEDYQTKGKFAPSGTDVYSAARDAIRSVGFRVTHVRQDEPVLPDDIDCLIWMQPRRDVGRTLEAASEYLHDGGKLFVATQYFNIQPRQYRGREFETVYWPQPQSPDTDRFYYSDIGVDLVREVLFDDLSIRTEVETHVNRDASTREYDEQEQALPFLIRAAASNFSPDSVITRGLGDQAFLWPTWIELDEARLNELGIESEVLMTTSELAWAFPWYGGFLPPAIFEGPLDLVATSDPATGKQRRLLREVVSDDLTIEGEVPAKRLGRAALAVHLRGTFPAWTDTRRLEQEAGKDASELPDPLRTEGGAPGELVIVSSSELFQNPRLSDPEFRADQLLIGAVCRLAVGEELADVAARRRVAPGFDYVAPKARLGWRAFVVGAGPLALLALGLVRSIGRRRDEGAGR